MSFLQMIASGRVANGQFESWKNEQQKRRGSLDKGHRVSRLAFRKDTSRMIVYNLYEEGKTSWAEEVYKTCITRIDICSRRHRGTLEAGIRGSDLKEGLKHFIYAGTCALEETRGWRGQEQSWNLRKWGSPTLSGRNDTSTCWMSISIFSR